MFRSLMTIIRELYLYLTKVIFMLKHWVKLRRSNIIVYFNVNSKFLTKFINSAFVGE